MNTRIRLSALWIFLTVNFIFCDVFSLHYQENLQQLLQGTADGTAITQDFLLLFSIIMEIPMMMILVSLMAGCRVNRIMNFIAAILLIGVQASTLFWGGNTYHYIFFSMVEFGACFGIIGVACRWQKEVAG